jgi:chemotaxis protein MotB
MGKKHKHPEHENHERWLVSYADFITLLFATFTALYAIATADLAKYTKFSKAVSEGFQQQSLFGGVGATLMKGMGGGQESFHSKKTGEGDGVLGKYQSLLPTGAVNKEAVLEAIKTELKELNKSLADSDEGSLKQATLTQDARGAKISFDSALFFDSGSAQLKPIAQKTLDKIGKALKMYSYQHFIQVEGHTDNQPIYTAIFPSNWELSAARASAVVRHLIVGPKLDPRHLSATGFADTRPLASNETTAGRQKNRRIDLVVFDLFIKAGEQLDKPMASDKKPSAKKVKGGFDPEVVIFETAPPR